MPTPKSSSAKRQPSVRRAWISRVALDRLAMALVSVISKHSSCGAMPCVLSCACTKSSSPSSSRLGPDRLMAQVSIWRSAAGCSASVASVLAITQRSTVGMMP